MKEGGIGGGGGGGGRMRGGVGRVRYLRITARTAAPLDVDTALPRWVNMRMGENMINTKRASMIPRLRSRIHE